MFRQKRLALSLAASCLLSMLMDRKRIRIFTFRSESGRKRKNSGIAFGGYALVVNGLEEDRKNILIRACGFKESRCSLYDLDVYSSRLRNERVLPPRTSRVIFEEGTFTPAYAISSTSRGTEVIHGRGV